MDCTSGWSSASAQDPFEHVDLRAAVASELASWPIDQQALHRQIWSYVGAERGSGIAPGRVIIALTELVDAAPMESVKQRQALMRSVILSCVEAYFGHLGGDIHGPAGIEYSREGHAASTRLGGEAVIRTVK